MRLKYHEPGAKLSSTSHSGQLLPGGTRSLQKVVTRLCHRVTAISGLSVRTVGFHKPATRMLPLLVFTPPLVCFLNHVWWAGEVRIPYTSYEMRTCHSFAHGVGLNPVSLLVWFSFLDLSGISSSTLWNQNLNYESILLRKKIFLKHTYSWLCWCIILRSYTLQRSATRLQSPSTCCPTCWRHTTYHRQTARPLQL